MLGQEMLISMASIGEASKRRVTSTYSSIVEPHTLAMKRVSLKSSCGRMLAHHLLDARVLQADGVQHPGGRLVHPVRRIAEARLAGGALENDGAGIAVGEALDAGVLLAEADAAREQHDGRGEIQAAELQSQRSRARRAPPACARIWFEARHGVHYRTRAQGHPG